MISQQVEQYLEAVAPRYAERSLTTFRSGLLRFEVYSECHGIESAAEVTEEVARSFQSWLGGSRLSESTVYIAVRALLRFMSWGHTAGLTLWDGQGVEMKHPQSTSPKPPTVAVMQRLLSLPSCSTPEGVRDAFALELLYVLGLRSGECSALNVVHLDLAQETLFVKGKGGDERLLPVSPGLKNLGQYYLFNARPKLLPKPEEKALLLGDAGQRLGPNGLYYIVKKYGERLDLKLTTHQLRHACATHLVESGMELEHIKQLLGHRRLSSTKRYTQIDTSAMEREFRRVHPRARRD